MASDRRSNRDEGQVRPRTPEPDSEAGEDTEGQSLHNYELVRALAHERASEAARIARDAARAREAREAKRSGR